MAELLGVAIFRLVCAEHVLDVKVVKVRYSKNQIIKMKRTITRGQLRCREARWEGRLWETCEPMDKNRIKGRHGLVSWHHTAKPIGASMEVNAAVVQGSIECLPREASLSCVVWLKSATKDNAARAVMCALNIEESAESIVVVEPPAMSKSAGRRTWRTRIR